jgi:DeoR/GlpR family transcriptional regulator of sugar metabolism
MLMVERQRRITEEVGRRSGVRVTELASLFRVTEETVRRDLETLQTQGKLVRSHGGAVAVADQSHEVHYSAREILNQAAKVSIAREALSLIAEDDTVMMDSSSTVLQLAILLPDRRLTVVTNSIKVAAELSSRPQVRVISIGGTLMASSLSFVGPWAEKCLDNYYVSKVFLSCRGFSATEGASDANELQALLKRRMLDRAGERYLLVDSSKFGVKSLSVWAQTAAFTAIVTDASSRSLDLDGIVELGVRVIRPA